MVKKDEIVKKKKSFISTLKYHTIFYTFVVVCDLKIFFNPCIYFFIGNFFVVIFCGIKISWNRSNYLVWKMNYKFPKLRTLSDSWYFWWSSHLFLGVVKIFLILYRYNILWHLTNKLISLHVNFRPTVFSKERQKKKKKIVVKKRKGTLCDSVAQIFFSLLMMRNCSNKRNWAA